MNWLRNVLGQWVPGAVVLIVLGTGAAQAASTEVVAGSRAAGVESCMAETDDMRRNHMDYLLHKRDKTVHQGVRTPDFSLNECVACHAGKDTSGQYVSVTEEGQFCQTCHVRVAAKLDCFQCHRTTPETHQ